MFIQELKHPLMLSVLLFSTLVSAETVTKVLQNGKDAYQGCVDSYTYSFTPEDNYSTNDVLFNHNCQN